MIPLFVATRLNTRYGIKTGPLTVPPVSRSEPPGDKPREPPPRPLKVSRYIRNSDPFKDLKLGI
jgi:hypothetical protein